jgi:hypothetical protein
MTIWLTPGGYPRRNVEETINGAMRVASAIVSRNGLVLYVPKLGLSVAMIATGHEVYYCKFCIYMNQAMNADACLPKNQPDRR